MVYCSLGQDGVYFPWSGFSCLVQEHLIAQFADQEQSMMEGIKYSMAGACALWKCQLSHKGLVPVAVIYFH